MFQLKRAVVVHCCDGKDRKIFSCILLYTKRQVKSICLLTHVWCLCALLELVGTSMVE